MLPRSWLLLPVLMTRGFRAPARAAQPIACMAARLPAWEDLAGRRVGFRSGEPADTLPIAARLLGAVGNPLIDHTQFIVCETVDGERQIIGFGQIKMLAPNGAANPSTYDGADLTHVLLPGRHFVPIVFKFCYLGDMLGLDVARSNTPLVPKRRVSQRGTRGI